MHADIECCQSRPSAMLLRPLADGLAVCLLLAAAVVLSQRPAAAEEADLRAFPGLVPAQGVAGLGVLCTSTI